VYKGLEAEWSRNKLSKTVFPFILSSNSRLWSRVGV
jgi:hypothetical protein